MDSLVLQIHSLEEVELEADAVVVPADVADEVAISVVVAAGIAMLEIAEATERPAKPKADQTRILKGLNGNEESYRLRSVFVDSAEGYKDPATEDPRIYI